LLEVAAVLVDAGIPAAVCHNAARDGALTQAQTMLRATRGKLDVIAVGGVSNGQEALTTLQSGSKAVQIATAVVKEGPAAFTRIKRELAQSMELAPAAL
jgi:dihydroorotate dehydrogenase